MYDYQKEKVNIFTDDGQKMFLSIRDHTKAVLAKSGAITMGKAMSASSGSTWVMMACVDRMVELNELHEIKQDGCAGQGRVFVPTNR